MLKIENFHLLQDQCIADDAIIAKLHNNCCTCIVCKHEAILHNKMATASTVAGVSVIPNPTAKMEVWEHFGYPGNESGGIAMK